MECGVLVPRRHQPVGGERGGQRSADDEAEVARACSRDEARLGAVGQRIDHRRRVLAAFGQRPAEGTAYGRGIGAGGHGAVVQSREERLRALGSGTEACGTVRHGPTIRRQVKLAVLDNSEATTPSARLAWRRRSGRESPSTATHYYPDTGRMARSRRAYGVFNDDAGFAYRGAFVVDVRCREQCP